jgi:hypothetical protein
MGVRNLASGDQRKFSKLFNQSSTFKSRHCHAMTKPRFSTLIQDIFCKDSNQRPNSHSRHSSSKRATYGTGIPQNRESTRHRGNNNNYGSERKLRVSFLKPKVILKGLLGSTVEAKDEA